MIDDKYEQVDESIRKLKQEQVDESIRRLNENFFGSKSYANRNFSIDAPVGSIQFDLDVRATKMLESWYVSCLEGNDEEYSYEDANSKLFKYVLSEKRHEFRDKVFNEVYERRIKGLENPADFSNITFYSKSTCEKVDSEIEALRQKAREEDHRFLPDYCYECSSDLEESVVQAMKKVTEEVVASLQNSTEEVVKEITEVPVCKNLD